MRIYISPGVYAALEDVTPSGNGGTVGEITARLQIHMSAGVARENELYQKDLARQGKISCSYCPPNRGENAKRKPRTDMHKTRRGR